MVSDGVDDVVTIPALGLSGDVDWAASMWVLTTEATRQQVMMFGGGGNNDGAAINLSTTEVEVWINGNSNTIESVALGTGWNYLVWGYDKVANALLAYINGSLEVTRAWTVGTVTDEGVLLARSTGAGAGNPGFGAVQLDEVAIWNIAPGVVPDVRGRHVFAEPNVVASWTMDSLHDGTRMIYNDRRDVSGSPHATDKLGDGIGGFHGVFTGFPVGSGDSGPFTLDVPYRVEYSL